MTRILIAGVLGGLAMFVWTSFAHIATPLGWAGFQTVKDEAALNTMLKTLGDRPGLYIFPGMDVHAKDQNAEMKRVEMATKVNPSGLLLYRPVGQGVEMQPSTMLSELVKEIVVCLIAAFLLTTTSLPKLWERAGFVAAIGAVASLETNASYRIWYGFPSDFTAAAILMSFVGYIIAGFVIGFIVKPRNLGA